MQKLQICDCTLRDGGYYTNWDFDQNIVDEYFKAVSNIPAITHIELGYRSKASGEYLGEYFYCPVYVLKRAREACNNKILAVMLNEKDTFIGDIDYLLDPCKPYIDMVRMAVDPKNLQRAATTAKAIKDKGFQVGFNIMYMSTWASDKEFIAQLKSLEEIVDYIFLVDSFGGVYPEDVNTAVKLIKSEINIPIGFHGHNNMELGLANSLAALNANCDVIDATITGMGRGAGNLKTELLLTTLQAQGKVHFDFNKLNPVVSVFSKLQSEYQWGTNLPYMISGAYSLPQKDVMSWISKKRYTTESIINALQNKKEDNYTDINIPKLTNEQSADEVVIVGGGPNAQKHSKALIQYCSKNPDAVIIHAGVRFIQLFNDITNRQYYCLLGSEGNKMNNETKLFSTDNRKCILEPSPRAMGTILPKHIEDITYELDKITFIENYPDSLLTIAFQLAIDLNSKKIKLYGLDGYDLKSDDQMIEVSAENQLLINKIISLPFEIASITPTNYSNLQEISIYRYL